MAICKDCAPQVWTYYDTGTLEVKMECDCPRNTYMHLDNHIPSLSSMQEDLQQQGIFFIITHGEC